MEHAREHAHGQAREWARAVASRSRSATTGINETDARIQARDITVGAWNYLAIDAAREAARLLDQSDMSTQPLAGVPVAVKDIYATADMPTGFGSALYEGFRPHRDAAAVARIRAAGGLIIGKSVTTEFAYAHPGKTRNPHNAAHTPGGSSSGSAAAVASGMVPLAIGTQTAGSMIRPASYCGVVGFKPTLGRIPLTDVLCFSENLDTAGVFARTVDDAALLAGIMMDDGAVREAQATMPARIGLFRPGYWQDLKPESRAACENAADRLRQAGIEIIDLVPPDDFDRLIATQTAVMHYEAARNFTHEWRTAREALSAPLAALIADGLTISRADYRAALGHAREMNQRMSEVFARVDALLTPSAPSEAPHGLSSTGDAICNRAWTHLGVPCLHLPFGKGLMGLPTGFQLIAPREHDTQLLSLGRAVESIIAL